MNIIYPKLSIIIPVYQSAKTIGSCLDSILSQCSDEIEIIVIDDGSTDSLKDALFPYLDKNLIRYFRLPHFGVSHARNYGLSVAVGKYVTFCDADDVYLPKALNRILKELNDDLPLIVFGAEVYNCNSKFILNNIEPPDKIYTEKIDEALYYETGSRPYVWNCYYLNDFISDNQILFCNDIDLGEDQIFQFNAFLSAKKVKYVSELCYRYYHCRDDSHMKYYLENPLPRMERHFRIIQKVYEVYRNKGIVPDRKFYEWIIDFIFIDFCGLGFKSRRPLQNQLSALIKTVNKPKRCVNATYAFKFRVLNSRFLQLFHYIYKKTKNIIYRQGN